MDLQWVCQLCDEVFDRQLDRIEHLRTSHEKIPYTFCSYSCYTKREIEVHVAVEHFTESLVVAVQPNVVVKTEVPLLKEESAASIETDDPNFGQSSAMEHSGIGDPSLRKCIMQNCSKILRKREMREHLVIHFSEKLKQLYNEKFSILLLQICLSET